jgi:deoxyribonuclease IV
VGFAIVICKVPSAIANRDYSTIGNRQFNPQSPTANSIGNPQSPSAIQNHKNPQPSIRNPQLTMPLLGAHMSIAGGLPRAVDRAKASRCDALQIFTKSAGQWRARPLPDDEVALFRRRVEETGISPVVAHNSYLINVAAAAPALRSQSMMALGEELDRAELLGLDGLVMHPGSYTTGSEREGLRAIGRAIKQLLKARPRHRVKVLLEHTAGQGTNLGHRFEHLATILEEVNGSPRVGVCLDTCHLLTAGYNLCTDEGYNETF